MWKNLRLRPILASVLVLAFTREVFAVDDLTANSDVSANVEQNEWVKEPVFTKTAWREGEEPAAVTNGLAKSGAESVTSYSNRIDGTVSSEMPEKEGQYTVRFTVAATPEYTGLEDARDFTIAASAEMKSGTYFSIYDYANHADFTVDSAALGTNTLERFPVYLKIKNGSPDGFEYGDLKNGTDDLRFFDTTGRVLPYEIETWDTNGVSTLWVCLSTMRKDTKFTMCWNLRDGCKLPGNVPAQVWADYVGVWHFDETISPAVAATTPSGDSTGNGFAAMPVTYATGARDLRDQAYSSTDSIFGNSRHNGSYANKTMQKKGCRFEVTNGKLMKLGSSFTFTGWFKSEHVGTVGTTDRNGAVIVSRKTKQNEAGGWYAQMLESQYSARAMREIYAQGGGTNDYYSAKISDTVMTNQWTFLCLAYDGGKMTISGGNSKFYSGTSTNTFTAATDNGQTISFGNYNGTNNSDIASFDGFFDEFRIRKGVVDNRYLEVEYAQGTNLLVKAGRMVVDESAVLKNEWKSTPSISQTQWESDKGMPSMKDFNLGVARRNDGTQAIVFYDRATGAMLGSDVPKRVGEFRAIITVAQGQEKPNDVTWGALEYAIEFRIVAGGGSHAIGINIDRILLLNDDFSVAGGTVQWQSYSDELETDEYPYWRHLDENGEDASSTPPTPECVDDWSVSLDFNLGGGTRHVCWYRGDWLWFLDGVRVGNTFNNGAYAEEYGLAGLSAEQNYLPWNYKSQRVIGFTDYDVDGWHRYVGQAVMQNKQDAVITSSLYTNGIGTIYFDALNGWANNVRDADGNPCYKLVLEVATQTKVDDFGQIHLPYRQYTSSNPDQEAAAYDPFYFADWRPVEMHVLRFDGEDCTDLGMRNELTLDIEEGGSCARFYRVVASVTNALQNARFRIRRTAIDPYYDMNPDGDAYILLDNIICSPPTAKVKLEPCGEFFPQKTGKQVLGYEGAFDPAFPSVSDVAVYGRAKGTIDGQPVPAGTVAAATMHYRWHYIEQKMTDWKYADLDPATLVSLKPLELPPFEGDIEFWFDLNQNGNFYTYADYSGTGLGLGDIKFSEEVTSVTNQAETAVQLSDGTRLGDWFVRTREGKSDYSEMKVVVKGIGAIDMFVSEDRVWRGFVSTSNIVLGGVYWRIEPRNRQTDGATAWNWSTNYWYVLDWDQSTGKAPTFPAAGRMSEGDTNSWSRMPDNAAQTGYLMFQVDETSMGVTIVRSDYQNFKDWNDSKGDYFVGSSADPTAITKGASANVRTYDENYAGWTDTVATNANWTLAFEYTPGNLYETFLPKSPYYGIWNVGKGMWVYSKYLEPTGGTALQMAGCGEGYVEMSTEKQGITWPRGIGEVSFKARVAQAISPEYAAFYDGGDPKGMTNYAFMARTCFDQWQNKGFSGDAALSLFAYFRAGKGGYEARWEQIKGIADNPLYPNDDIGPDPTGQRLVISRWNTSGNVYVETELIATTNYVFDSWKVKMPTMMEGVSTNNFMPFVISAYNTAEATWVIAAVRIDKSAKIPPPAGGGVSRNATVSNGSYWYCVAYKDESPQRFKSGTYGVMSSNCEGLFMTPQFSNQPVWPEKINSKAMNKMTDVKTWNRCAVMSLKNYDYARFRAGSCAQDIAEDWWTVSWDDPGRMEAFVDFYNPNAHDYGFSYVPPYQTVDVYTQPRNASGSWHKIGQIDVDGFGTPGRQPDCVTNLCYASDCYLRLQTGGGLDDYRTDVAIDDVKISQWRGYDDWTPQGKTKSDSNYGATNIIFTTGWVTNGAVQLSARRTVVGTACSVRSPLMDGKNGRGIGLGMIGFSYRQPQTNINLLVQIFTNESKLAVNNLKTVSQSVVANADNWITITNLTYDVLTNSEFFDVKTGRGAWRTGSELGLHGVKGLMRIVVDNELVKEVKSTADATAFGEIDILEVVCKDEPSIDRGCWWGWNMRTIGDPFDTERRMFLPDHTINLKALGQSLALNNSITDGVDPKESPVDVRQHMPFLQSPTFTNAVIGQVTFKARKYDLSEYAPAAKVVVYGAELKKSEDELAHDDQWKFIAEFPITNVLYTTYTCKTDAEGYKALRLAVVLPEGETEDPPPEAEHVVAPQRVLLDEVSISEAVRAMLAFRNVGAFRSDLDGNNYVKGVTTSEQQPLCDENWGVQGELFATMLGDEILIDAKHQPKVRLHWYVGDEPWGYENWKKLPIDRKNRTRGSAYLGQTEGSNLVYRSSYKTNPESVLPAQTTPGTVVQYMLEVQYWTINSTKAGAEPVLATNWLDSASWTVPAWYAPVDYNTDPAYGASKTFAAFTILDTVAPGWAWINEMNIFGVRQSGGGNSEQASQFVEVCVPAEADLTGWKVRMLDAYLNGKVETNNVATFGVGRLTGKKQVTSGMRYGKVFRSIGTKEGDGMKYADGTLDAPWVFSNPKGSFAKGDGYYYISDYEQPIGVQLLRPSGIIEHSIVVIGTNRWGRLPGTKAYDPTNFVAILNRSVPGSRFFYAGEDCCGEKRTDSVMRSQGEDASVWTNNWVFTPGNLNHAVDGTEQTIGDHPSPHGDSIVVYASVDTTVGHITYKVGDGEVTTEPQMIVLKRGSDVGTNITYYAANWYEVASITTNDAPFWKYQRCVRETNVWVGVHASNNLYVVGAAQVNSDLADKYGLTKDNPFTPAVMDWLEGGKTLKGDFANPGEIHLADYQDSQIATNLTLTQMYCLDMDPTVSNLLFQTWYKWLGHVYRRENTLTNDQIKVFMMITNRNENAEAPVAWSPYVLRGLEPGSHSWQFKNPAWEGETISSWTSETFKVTGILRNGFTSFNNPDNWIPLNWFVFHEDSFYQETADGHDRFTAEIEVLDPRSQSSPGADSEWYDWCRKNGWTPVWYKWAINMKLRPVGVEVLTPNNYWE